jgi:hypothetical protein
MKVIEFTKSMFLLLGLALFLVFSNSVAAQQYHPLSEVTPIDVNFDMFQKNMTNVSYVGIGLTNPSYPLHVSGDIYSTGSVYGATALCIATDCKTAWSQIPGTPAPWDNSSTQIFIKAGYPTFINASNILFVNNTAGNVGIGTVNPNATLDVFGNIDLSGGARTIRTSTTDSALTINSNGTGDLTLDSGTTGIVNLGTNANAKTINIGTGAAVANPINIGGTGANTIAIGNTQTAGSIAMGAAMTTGTITIGGTGAQTGTISIGTGTGAQTINLGTGTGAKTITIGTGAVANVLTIGSTTGAASTLVQSGTGNVILSSTNQVIINSSKAAGGTTTEAFSIKSTVDLGAGDEVLQVGDSAADFVTILGNGNVGIGTASPLNALDVVGTVNVTNQVCIAGTCRSTWPSGNASGVGTANYIPKWSDSSNLTNSIIYDNGNVGIGTTNPISRLQINDSIFPTVRINNEVNSTTEAGIRFRDKDSAGSDFHADIFINSTGAETGRLGIRVPYTAEVMSITTGGYVGIGTTSPQNKLNVIGDINATGTIYGTLSASGSLTPSADNNYDLGSASNMWRNAWIAGNLYLKGNLTNVNVSTLNVNGSMIPPIDNLFTVGNSSYRWASANFAGTVTATTFSGSLSGSADMVDNYHGYNFAGSLGTSGNTVTLVSVNGTTMSSVTAPYATNAGQLNGQVSTYYLNTSTVHGGNVTGAYNALNLAANSVDSAKIVDGSVGAGDLATTISLGSGQSIAYGSGTLNANQLNGQVSTYYLNTSTVHGGNVTGAYNALNLAANSVDSAKIVDGSVGAGDLATTISLGSGQSIAYGSGTLNANQLNGQVSTYYLDTSATAQTKSGSLTISGTWLNATNVNVATSIYSAIYYDSSGTTYYLDPANTGTALNLAGDITLGSGAQVDFYDEVGDKAYWYSNTYGTGIESSTLTHWSGTRFRWRTGGTSVSTGTEKMTLTSTGLKIGGGDASYVLDVAGDVYLTGKVYDSGTTYYLDPNSDPSMNIAGNITMANNKAITMGSGSVYWDSTNSRLVIKVA